MPKKEDWKSFVKSAVSSSVLSSVKTASKDILKKAQEVVYHTQQKMMEFFAAGIIMITGIVIMLIGLVYLVNDAFQLKAQWGYLIVGFLILLTGKIFMNKADKTKYMG